MRKAKTKNSNGSSLSTLLCQGLFFFFFFVKIFSEVFSLNQQTHRVTFMVTVLSVFFFFYKMLVKKIWRLTVKNMPLLDSET